MNFFKFSTLLLFLTFSLYANQYNVILFSTKVVYEKDKTALYDRFKNGTIEKQKKYYVFKVPHIEGYQNAKKILNSAKKYYKDAFIVADSSEQILKQGNYSPKNSDDTLHIQKPTKNIKINEPVIDQKNNHLKLTSDKISYQNDRPKLNEPKILEKWQEPNRYKTTDTKLYDILNLTRYIDALFNYNDSAKEAYYQKKIEYVLSEIRKDKYNFDVYVDAYLRTGTSVSTNGTDIEDNGRYTNAGISLNANKRVYDGGYWLTKHTYDILYKRLASIKEINSQEKLYLLGVAIYTDMYASQEELSMYKKVIKKQKNVVKMVDEGYKIDKNSLLDHISAHNDYINMQRMLLDAKYQYRYSDYILRHSIKSRSEKPFKLYPAKINLQTQSLKMLQKEAIRQSSDVAIESNLLKIKETDLKYDENRYYPRIDFTSNIGYGLSKDDTFSLGGAGRGAFWSLGLTARIPIYEREDIILSKQRDRYEILKQKRVLSAKQRSILIQIEKSYNELKRIEKQKEFLKQLSSLSLKKMKILTQRYLVGISPYKDYSDALFNYLNYKNQLIKMEQSYIKELALLSILTGKKKFHEQN